MRPPSLLAARLHKSSNEIRYMIARVLTARPCLAATVPFLGGPRPAPAPLSSLITAQTFLALPVHRAFILASR
jgi:hypothetical protein